MADSKHPKLYLVDGSGFIFRAFHALPPMNRSDGTPTNAVFGFCNMLLKLIADLGAEHMAVIFDAKRSNFRNEIYPDYKANRDDPPEELVPQFGLIREATEAFGLPAIEQEGYEADDLIATYAKQAKARGQEVVIVSSDKDLMQLINDHVAMFDPMKAKQLGEADVVEKFGVPPAQMIDLQALAGDSVDNIPGVPGIGVKTAAALLAEFGDLETLLDRAETIKQKGRRQKLLDHAEDARISKQLVRLEDEVPLAIPLDRLPEPKLGSEPLLQFLERNEFKAILRRLTDKNGAAANSAATARDATAAEAGPPAVDRSGYVLIQDQETLKAWIAAAREAGVIGFDTETDGLVPSVANLIGVSLATGPGRAAYLPLGHVAREEGALDLDGSAAPDQLPMRTALTLLKPLLEDPAVLKVAQNAKYDLQVFAQHGIAVAPVDDSMLLSYLLHGSQHGHGLDELSQRYLDHAPIKYEEVAGKGKDHIGFARVALDTARDYAAEDADLCLMLWRLFRPRLVPDRLMTVHETIERPLIPVVAAMEQAGIKVDAQVLKRMSGDFAGRLEALEGEIHDLAGHPFTIGSPQQLGQVLFEELGLAGGRKTKTGQYSTTADILEGLALEHPIIEKVLAWRQLAKLKSTYTDALQNDIQAKTGRVHTSFSMALTNTGRLSSSDPNLQNIPIRTEEGRAIRTAFIAEAGHKLISADYSQIELRLVADLAGVDALRESFLNGEDIHARTASEVFGVPMAEMTPELRRQAKAINFGIIYGISGYGLARQLGVPQKEASAYIGQYLGKYWQLSDYFDRTKAFARDHGYVTTKFGRKVWLAGIKDKNQARRAFAERQAINAPLQGTAADIIKKAMIRLHRALAEGGYKTRMLLQVHDELIFEAPKAEVEDVSALIKRIMEGVTALAVPLIVEANAADSWAEAH